MNVKKSEERDIGETWRGGNGKMMQLYYYLKNQIIFLKTFDLKEWLFSFLKSNEYDSWIVSVSEPSLGEIYLLHKTLCNPLPAGCMGI